jgi:hypothetical protein
VATDFNAHTLHSQVSFDSMPRPTTSSTPKTTRARTRRPRVPRPKGRAQRRWRRTIQRVPRAVKIILAMAAVLTLSIALNWIYQVVRKPSELLFPVSGAFSKRPAETWAEYAPLFRKFATHVMTPDLLAAMAQVDLAPVRNLPAGVERRRHVSDHRRHVCRRQPLLHS